jgi:hypothetical protein
MDINSNLIHLDLLGDARGKLAVFEANRNVPFDIKRVFYIFNVEKNKIRGEHAHYKTKQVLIALKGSCKVKLNNGFQEEEIILDNPQLALIQQEMIWGTMSEFSEDCILMVLANELYDESDYIRDYKVFLKEIQK